MKQSESSSVYVKTSIIYLIKRFWGAGEISMCKGQAKNLYRMLVIFGPSGSAALKTVPIP